MHWYGGWSWGAWLLMASMMVAFWALVAWAVVAVIRAVGSGHRSSAIDVLDERFARGEIDEEEYRRRRALLQHP